jgi:ABC-type transport system involved in multi-copper enzyme maturation permease subunit
MFAFEQFFDHMTRNYTENAFLVYGMGFAQPWSMKKTISLRWITLMLGILVAIVVVLTVFSKNLSLSSVPAHYTGEPFNLVKQLEGFQPFRVFVEHF